jgi:hypothetical protein
MEGILHACEKKTHEYASLKAYEDLRLLRAKRSRKLEEYGAAPRQVSAGAFDPARRRHHARTRALAG